MTFEEWLSRTIPLDPAQQMVAKCAWDAATKEAVATEREACAKLCESMNGERNGDCAEAIRARSDK
jgi:hypothetical protein